MALAPNKINVVRDAAERYPDAWAKAKTRDDDGSFIRIVARLLWEEDQKFGLNGKRGSATDISLDAVSYLNPNSGAGGVEIIDVIVAHTSDQAKPGWNDVTQATIDAHTIGRWIKPPPTGAEPPPTDPTDIGAQLNDLVRRIEALEQTSGPDVNRRLTGLETIVGTIVQWAESYAKLRT